MISPEEAHGAAASVFHQLNMPSDISLTMQSLRREGVEYEVLRVTCLFGADPEEPDFTFAVAIENNPALDALKFNAWMLGWAMATLGIFTQLDQDAAMLAESTPPERLN